MSLYISLYILATWFYEYFIKHFGLVRTAIAGAVLHFCFVLGTIGGLFVEGSMYQLYQGYETKDECPTQLNTTVLQEQTKLMAWSNSSIISNHVVDFSAACTPPESYFSILFMLVCCAMSRCGLWLFDLAVSQMFQEWVEPRKVLHFFTFTELLYTVAGRVSGSRDFWLPDFQIFTLCWLLKKG